jgi:Ca-activated chloride channel family protein
MMRFIWPDLLWLLLLLPALVVAYLFVLRRKKKSSIRYASLLLVREAIAPGARFRRHVPPLLFLLAMAAAILAAARPSAVVTLPSQSLTLILAMDVSRSMLAADVKPNRISAAQEAARTFVSEMPKGVRVGIVSFAGTASVVQTPTENREDLLAAIDRFQLQRQTATGSGLILSLATLLPEAGIDLEAAVYDSAFSRFGGGAAPLDRARKAEKGDKKTFKPVPPGSYTAGGIILLSDGRRTTGPNPLEAAKMAADRGVRVHTVGLGTKEGATLGFEGSSYYTMLDEETLRAVAKITDGEYFNATTASGLRKVYEHLSLQIALERRETEVGALLSALAALLVLSAALLSVLWFQQRI